MRYGLIECSIESEHGRVHLTVTGRVISIKQGGDLIRLSRDEALELAEDIADSVTELKAGRA